ncbi:MAG: flagellar hook assembly protein FlgD [Hyphomicrobiales bacterium]|nr:flagellar hook assembly protein FlgD [Hyphomicrobiales bacterium]
MAVSPTNTAAGQTGLSLALRNQATAQANAAANPAASTDAKTRLNGNFDTFLTLLTTQLRNQNPLDPLNTEQFTQQITQYTGVEQQLKTNDLLQRLVNNQSGGSLTSALGFLGNNIVANGDSAQLSNGQANWTLNATSNVNATITITNATGQVVRTEQRALQAGSTNYQWNGRDDTGVAQVNGSYKIAITARSSDGTQQTVSTRSSGRVTAVDLSNGEAILTVNGAKVKLSDVTSVSTPGG